MSLPQAVPHTPPPKPAPEKRRYVVLSRKCVWGAAGETIELALGEQEAALLAAGTLKRAEDKPAAPEPKTPTAPVVDLKKEGE